VLLFFGYTRCPDVCPTTLADWARLRRALGEDAAAMRFVFVSVDPARDTPADAQRYAARFDPAFVGLVADTASIERLKAGFRIAAHEEPGHAGHYTVAHSTQTFVVDGEGRLRVLHPQSGTVADLEADVRRLLD
jgi:protein SCO1/2